ncbi:glucose-6-phosphate isomerase [Nonomuraea sp. MG754425]|uniref:glucose-6-phosphate isomerase n=1 Tax=Nonomuraea sp. MG754425 TaxID=2570319 RepID=UPI001F25965B|nr:glucose-6-phosphate isomerase [Nonomuraea sp. MG754425]MCF6470912.1 glucose-6-phosphate isomerase [Nonomuraea sp. MG754425]
MEVSFREEGVASAASSVAGRLVADGVPARLAGGDPTLWGEDAEAEAAVRLGWLTLPRSSRELLPALGELAAGARAEGLTNVVLAGMGGSSLAAEVICATFDVPLTVLDTTDPGQVRRALAERLEATVVVVASKSGSTVETDCLLRIYRELFAEAGLDPAGRVVVVTDPGSPLERLAADGGHRVVLAPPDVGGRFSALSPYGLVPAALAGADVARLLDDAGQVLPLLSLDSGNPGLDLGCALGGAALAGRDKLVLDDQLSPSYGLPDWIEQLVAESTGKRGRGILPVVGADPTGAADELVVAIESDAGDVRVDGPLGAQFLVWEYATAIAGLLLGVDPFDQPNVAESKENTAVLLALPDLPVGAPAFVDGPVEVYGAATAKDLPGVFAALLNAVPGDGYLAVMAYLDRLAAFDAPVPDGADFEQMTDAWMMADPLTLRALLALRTDRPVTFGWGPRFLHSTGQYHKGGPQNGVFLQITGAVTDDVAVPGRPYGLGGLQLAQALGDLGALETRGRPAVRLHLTDRAAGVARLLEAAQEA